MSLHSVYRLACTSQAYFKAVVPRGAAVLHDTSDSVHYAASGFYTLSKEPMVIMEDATRNLIERRRVFEREQREALFKEYGSKERFDWRPEEFAFTGEDMADGRQSGMYAVYMEAHLAVAKCEYIDMIAGIQLTVVEVLSPEHSSVIDKAERFITNRELYLSGYHYAAGTSTMRAVQRELHAVEELVRERLLGRHEVQDELAKLVFDLEHRFPAGNDI